ncbi:hypothetical protein NUW54_g1303 [Trametes sanguinea]|uniref:Uncharacterized protein n=2 Tax=Trametes sanguinea TaxID=158606 RepID=A0ACC1Q6Q1_9APHY|nr:hypothetical protein NUW54_g2990 [Trametes sanguinea]KAJ3014459.1 hypothetical protein NUW54_g1303 [Trametes sanguinea]
MVPTKGKYCKVASSITVGVRDVKHVGVKTIGSHEAKKSALQIRKEHNVLLERQKAMLDSLPATTCAAVSFIVVGHGAPPGNPSLPQNGDLFYANGNAWIDVDEGNELISSVGGEYGDAETQATLLHIQGSRATTSQRSNIRSHRERLRAKDQHWAAQLQQLIDAYLAWKHNISLHSDTVSPRHASREDPFNIATTPSAPSQSSTLPRRYLMMTLLALSAAA